MFQRWPHLLLLLTIISAAGVVCANPLQGVDALSKEKETEILYLEADQLVKGFAAEFPRTLSAMPDNPLNNKMNALKALLKDEKFQDVMIAVALETLKKADVETIVKAKALGVVDEKYITEMVQISWNFADKITPLIMEALNVTPEASNPMPS